MFKDTIKFDKKVDPKKLKFGSKLDNPCSERETYYKVKEIVSPEILILSNGLKIRLVGLKGKPDKNKEVIQFLRDKTSGQKVFLKFDNVKYDKKNNLLGYLFLWNKTFLNAHLIKKGLADVDNTFDYEYLAKFSNLQKQVVQGDNK